MDHRPGRCCSLHTFRNDSTKSTSHNQNKMCQYFKSFSLFLCCYVKFKTVWRQWTVEKDQPWWDRTVRWRPSSRVSAFSILCSIKCPYTLQPGPDFWKFILVSKHLDVSIMLLLNLDEPLCINEAFTDLRSWVQPAGHHSLKTGDMWIGQTPSSQSARSGQMSLSRSPWTGLLDMSPVCSFFHFNVSVTCWHKYSFYNLFVICISTFSSQA